MAFVGFGTYTKDDYRKTLDICQGIGLRAVLYMHEDIWGVCTGNRELEITGRRCQGAGVERHTRGRDSVYFAHPAQCVAGGDSLDYGMQGIIFS